MKSNHFIKKHTDIRIIKEEKQKKKFNWDKIIYLFILFSSLAILVSYLFNKYFYITGDGKVLFETLDVQLVNDVQVKKIKCEIGDSIKIGDTLFYYVNEDHNNGYGSGSRVHNTIENNNWKEREKIRIQDQISLKEIEKTENAALLDKLNLDKERVQKEVYLDVYTADGLDIYIRQINDYLYKIKSLEEEIKLLKRTLVKIDQIYDESSPLNLSIRFQDSINYINSLEHPYVSQINGVISHIFKKEYETVLESEHILAIHVPSDKVYIKAFFEQEDVKHLHVDDIVNVEFANGYNTKGRIQRFYFDTYDLPIYLKSRTEDLHHDIEADIVPYNKLEIPLWKKSQKLDVKIIKQRYF